MQITLVCKECGNKEWGSTHHRLMDRIKMWNHIRHAHLYLDPKPNELYLFMEEVSPREIYSAKKFRQLSYY